MSETRKILRGRSREAFLCAPHMPPRVARNTLRRGNFIPRRGPHPVWQRSGSCLRQGRWGPVTVQAPHWKMRGFEPPQQGGPLKAPTVIRRCPRSVVTVPIRALGCELSGHMASNRSEKLVTDWLTRRISCRESSRYRQLIHRDDDHTPLRVNRLCYHDLNGTTLCGIAARVSSRIVGV
jgi:hypothetical protein